MMGGANATRTFDDDGDDGTVAWVMAGLMVLLVAVAALALWRLRPEPRRPEASAAAILKRRLAAGEIDPDDYERRLKALEEAT